MVSGLLETRNFERMENQWWFRGAHCDHIREPVVFYVMQRVAPTPTPMLVLFQSLDRSRRLPCHAGVAAQLSAAHGRFSRGHILHLRPQLSACLLDYP